MTLMALFNAIFLPGKDAHNVPEFTAHLKSQHNHESMPHVSNARIRDKGQAGREGKIRQEENV
jgi:hypothetical protein